MRRPALALLAVLALGVAALLVLGSQRDRDVAFSLGVVPSTPIELKPGAELCQGVVSAADGFDAVRLQVGTFERPGSSFRLLLRAPDGERLADRRVSGGYADNERLTVPVGTVSEGTRFELCVTDTGRRAIAPYGGAALASRSTEATLNGRPLPQDMSADFMRAKPVSLLALAPEMAERASLFHGKWVGAWTIWLLAVCVLAVVPALLLLALRASVR
jgi:hypothetical protein